MKIKGIDKKTKYNVWTCPFCGGKPKFEYYADDTTISVKLICWDCCCQRTMVDLKEKNRDFGRLERISVKYWNRRNLNVS